MASLDPLIFLLSDYPSMDTGSAGGYDGSMRLYLPDLDFRQPNRVKVLESLELQYESLFEVPMTCAVYRSMVETDPGQRVETVAFAQASGALSGNAQWGASWTGKNYGTLRLFLADFQFVPSQGKFFSVGLKIDANLTPFRLVKASFGYSTEHQPQLGTGVTKL